jgi:hypothetical protein
MLHILLFGSYTQVTRTNEKIAQGALSSLRPVAGGYGYLCVDPILATIMMLVLHTAGLAHITAWRGVQEFIAPPQNLKGVNFKR